MMVFLVWLHVLAAVSWIGGSIFLFPKETLPRRRIASSRFARGWSPTSPRASPPSDGMRRIRWTAIAVETTAGQQDVLCIGLDIADG